MEEVYDVVGERVIGVDEEDFSAGHSRNVDGIVVDLNGEWTGQSRVIFMVEGCHVDAVKAFF